ncbi:ATP-binding cassette domain-containing protein [Ruicaihuangia caeni]|uniref:ATP-binding cassette domain-containing protein n=1 Tax=Ruicaihuangia caeni TaxID=3042517 RepID=A0AAW6T8W6_9MICO|nr:ATP-binding cassette domain-containing protein [Klugiella sp. YN-L-19]MDI2099221.1 ATP-binding cassette domain-containing protein [Klugiella sp. YN-L-19]
MSPPSPVAQRQPVLAARGIHQRFGGVHALRGIDLELFPGEVLALVGDNGAGKSTLLKILSGNNRPTSGEVLVEGRAHEFKNPAEASAAGIATVYQDLALALDLDVVENMFLGREVSVRGAGRLTGHLDRALMAKRTREALDRVHIRIPDIEARCVDLSGGQRQAVAIARAVTWCDKVLLLDEPTAALGVEQQQEVLNLITSIRERLDLAIVLVSHQLSHVLEVADRIAVLRQGRIVRVFDRDEATSSSLVAAITGLTEGDEE